MSAQGAARYSTNAPVVRLQQTDQLLPDPAVAAPARG